MPPASLTQCTRAQDPTRARPPPPCPCSAPRPLCVSGLPSTSVHPPSTHPCVPSSRPLVESCAPSAAARHHRAPPRHQRTVRSTRSRASSYTAPLLSSLADSLSLSLSLSLCTSRAHRWAPKSHAATRCALRSVRARGRPPASISPPPQCAGRRLPSCRWYTYAAAHGGAPHYPLSATTPSIDAARRVGRPLAAPRPYLSMPSAALAGALSSRKVHRRPSRLTKAR